MGEDKARQGAGPLNGWRAIALYLGRNQSTVKRWAAENGLPVHRPQGKGAQKGVPVYAFAGELDSWLRGKQHLDDEPPDPAPPPAPSPAKPRALAPSTVRKSSLRHPLRWGAAAIVALLVCGAGWLVYTIADEPEAQRLAASEVPGAGHELYLSGLYHQNLRTGEGLRTALNLFTQSLEADPGSVDAQAALAQTYNLAPQYGVLPAGEAYPQGRRAAEDALAIEPGHAGALAALAFNTFYWTRDFSAAYDLYERALRLDPDNGQVHHWYALAAMHDRRFDLALREIDIAQRLLPESPSILANKALILHHSGSSEGALSILEPLAQSQPGLLSPSSYLATIYLDTQRDLEFVGAYSAAAKISGNISQQQIADAARAGLQTSGRSGMLQAMLDMQRQLYVQGQEPAFKLAVTESYLGNAENALAYLQVAIEREEPEALGIRLEVALATLETSPRYNMLVQQVGFGTR